MLFRGLPLDKRVAFDVLCRRAVRLLKSDFFGFAILRFCACAFSFHNIIDRLLRWCRSFFFFRFFGGWGWFGGLFTVFPTDIRVFENMYAHETKDE